MLHTIILKKFALLFLLLAAFSCNDDTEEISNDPANLTINVTIVEEGSGDVLIQAQAENANLYELRINAAEEATDSNATGTFEYTFLQNGIYDIEVRAYNGEGRYIKGVRQVTITLGSNVTPDDGYTTPVEYAGYKLIWNDEFNGNSVNTDDWTFEIGTGCPNCGWGNNELQYYREQNASVTDGILTIEARRESYDGNQYTSTRMKTQGKVSFKYGRVDIRALLPEGQGIWPALWMLGENITSVGWPKCGEIDIMEMIGGNGRENTVHGTLHWDNGAHASAGDGYTLSSGTFADEYHVFSMIWDATSIKWYVNDTHFHTINITAADMSEFHEKHFFIFNVAVGGNWPGNPDGTTVFPQQMKVDYVRVFQPE